MTFFTDLDWRKEAPDVVEQAVSLCIGIKADKFSDYSAVLRDLEPETPYRLDLAAVVWQEIYKRRTPSWIYFAQVGAGDVVKVGRSTGVVDRLVALSRKHEVEHHLLGSIRGDYREEGRLHRYFRRHRLKNLKGREREYFRLEPLRPTIDAILAAGELIELPYRPLP